MADANPNLFIKFKGIEHDSEVELAELGESLIGFDSLFKNFGEILRVDGTLEVKATATNEGSVIVEILVTLQQAGLAFESIADFLAALKVAGHPLWQDAVAFFNTIEGAHKTLNDWASKYPLDAAFITALLGLAFKKLFQKARKSKEKPAYDDPELSKRIADELFKLIKKHGFKKMLRPIVEDKADSIELDTDRNFSSPVRVDQLNFQDLLAEDAQILPHLENGQTATLSGGITSLKGTRGDSLTFHLKHGAETFNLDVLPREGSTTKAYRNFYQERVEIKATVIRDSLYKKPKLRLQEITLTQPELGLTTSGANDGFVLGRKYSRKEISERLGGSEVDYLPTENNRVVCGCFTPAHNPEAPDIVIPGTGKVIERTAKIFCEQETPIPIFIKQRSNEWEYVGDYIAERFSTDAAEIAAHHNGSITPLHEVTRVIFLKRASRGTD